MPQPEGAELIAADVASLVLVRRAHKRTAWAFTQRAHGAPPLATMAEPLRKFESVGRIAGADPESFWWWLQDEALDHIGRELASKNYCVIDGLLGPHALRALRDEVAALRDTGRLQPSKLAGGRTGGMLTYTHTAVRGDHVAWFDGDEGEATWPSRTLSRYLQKVDTLVAQLAEHAGEQLRSIASRSKAMVTCYPGGGARYVRHCDNSCDSGHGDRCNGRRLTAILYLNERWGPLHGGELRVHPPFAPKGQPPLCDVAPLGDRLILFYADYRVPHEVLPAHVARLAITVWYFDRDEYTRARASGSEASEQTDHREQEAIEAEIRRFEERFGEGTVRHGEKGDGPTALAAG